MNILEATMNEVKGDSALVYMLLFLIGIALLAMLGSEIGDRIAAHKYLKRSRIKRRAAAMEHRPSSHIDCRSDATPFGQGYRPMREDNHPEPKLPPRKP